MDDHDYQCSISAKTTAKETFKKISHVQDWWAKNYGGNSQNMNDVFTVRFGETFVTFKIIEVVQDKKVVWLVTDCFLSWLSDKTEWNGTKIVFELFEENNSTNINFTHVGLKPQIECYNDCIKGWDQHLKGSLLKLLNEGKGTPS